ncbi:MAG TPA: S8 family serine peptidase [Polyangiaceae bacterium]|nr:S8 family serine peptidase [Polyangiaceae bacterium]
MPHVRFGTKDEPGFDLSKSDRLIAVRTRSRRSLRAGPVPPRSAAEIVDGELVLAFPEAGVEVYRVAPDKKSLDDRKRALRRDPDVEFAGGVLVDDANEPVLYTENLFVKFVNEADPDDCKEVLQRAGLSVKKELGYATNAFFVSAPEGTGERIFEIAEALHARADVEYCHPELVRHRARKGIFAPQWHLKTAVIGGRVVNAHAHVEPAHAVTRGKGVTIAIIDDGIDVDHPEFDTDGKVVAPRDVAFPLAHPQGEDPRPKDSNPRYPEDHGTACAGVACASGIDGASGVAPEACLLPIRLSAGLGSQQEAEAFQWAADHGADVISCSWGPPDGAWWDPDDPLHRQKFFLPASTRLAIDYAVSNGRGGRGCVILFAAGNGNESVDNDGYASYERVIAVAACNDRGTRSVYSDFGAAVWCAFPSNDAAWPEQGRPEPLTPGIWTTDRMARLGYNPGIAEAGDVVGNYTNGFGGTSSACPGAAGVAALVLSQNPELRWNEVKALLGRACEQIDLPGGDYDQRGKSPFYGFGRLSAELAVGLARHAVRDTVVVSKTFQRPILDLETIEVSLDVAETENVASLGVSIELEHTYIGDLVITLVPPSGRGFSEVDLHRRVGGATRDLRRTYDVSNTAGLAQFEGKRCDGRWSLRIRDAAAEDTGTLVRFGIELRFDRERLPGDSGTLRLRTEGLARDVPSPARA